jgi:hypothetical protein
MSKKPKDFIARNRHKVTELSQNQKLIRLNSQSVPRAPAKKKSGKKPKLAKQPTTVTLKCLQRPMSFMLVEKAFTQSAHLGIDTTPTMQSPQTLPVMAPLVASSPASAESLSSKKSVPQTSPALIDVVNTGSSQKRKRSVDSSVSSKRLKLSS